MEYRSKNSDIGSDNIGGHGRPAKKYDMGARKTSRGGLELDNALDGYDGLPVSLKDSYKEQDKKFVKEISNDLL